jgi:hypothetical protein
MPGRNRTRSWMLVPDDAAAARSARPATARARTEAVPSPPLTECRYRHRKTGALAVLSIREIIPPAGAPPWFEVRVARPNGAPVPPLEPVTRAESRGLARQLWVIRAQVLRTEGYERF